MATDSPKVPLNNKPGVRNWVEKYNALGSKDNWIRRVAEHLKGKGEPEGIAIPTAVNAAQKACETGDLNFPGFQQINPGGRAEACAAYKTWTLAKQRAHAAKATDMSARRACDAFRHVDLARAYLRYQDGEVMRLPEGAYAAYSDLSAERSGTVDLASRPDQLAGFHGRLSAMGDHVKKLANRDGVFISEHQHDTIAAHALAHGQPQSVTKGVGGNVVVGFQNGQLHSFGSHGGSDRLDNLPASGGQKPPLSSAERQAIVAEEVMKARKEVAPNGSGTSAQNAAIKGIARKRALERINSADRIRGAM